MKKKKSSVWDSPEQLATLEKQRNKFKQVGKRMTYECMNTVTDGDRVKCGLGKVLGTANDGSAALITVLRGVCSGVCKECEDYNTEEGA